VRRDIAASFARPLCWAGLAGIGAGVWLLDVSGHFPLSIRSLQFLAFSLLTLVTWLAYADTGLVRIGERLVLFRAVLELGRSAPMMAGSSNLLDWFLDCCAIGVVLSVIWLAREIWLGLIAIDDEGSFPQKAAPAPGCEIIDMKEWKARTASRTSSVTRSGHRRL